MAGCDTQIPPNMTDTNRVMAAGDGVINAAGPRKASDRSRSTRPSTSRSARSSGNGLTDASLPENELLTRFRHVYAGKGGWYGYRGAKHGGPINTGNVPPGFVSKYKREILKKLSKSLQDQAGQQSSPDTGNKDNNVEGDRRVAGLAAGDTEKLKTKDSEDKIDIANTTDENGFPAKHSKLLSKESGNEVSEEVLRLKVVASDSVGTVRDTSGRSSRCEHAEIAVSSHGEPRQKDTDTPVVIDEKLESLARLQTLNALAGNEHDECLTNSPLNSIHAQPGNIEKEIGALRISGRCADSTDSNDEIHGQAPHTVRSCPTIQDITGSGEHTSKHGLKAHKTAAHKNTPTKKGGRTPRCKTLPASHRTKSHKPSTRNKSVTNGGSSEAQNIRMTLFSRLSQEAQWAISETRREMGVSPDRDSLRLNDDSVPSDASDPGEHGSVRDLNIAPDPLGDSDGYHRETGYGLDTAQSSDSLEPGRDHDAMLSRGDRKTEKGRPKTYTQETNPRGNGKAVAGLTRRKAGHGHGGIAETQITEVPLSGGGRANKRSTHKARFNQQNHKTVFPDIASELDEERGRIAGISREDTVGHRIPGVGQYTIVPHAMLRREQTFEITPPGYDSRFDGPRLDLNVEDDTPEEIKQLAIAKCSEWLTKHFVS